MRIDVLTLFPAMFEGFLREGTLRIAREKGLVEVGLVNFRDFSDDPHRKVDDRPYGGGPGMVLAAGPILSALDDLAARRGAPGRRILLSPRGVRFDQGMARDLAREPHLVLVCGRYEGVDERVLLGTGAEEVSVGDFVLSGGEIAAMAVVEAVARLVPGVVGDRESLSEETFSGGLLEYPQYTRPEVFRGMAVPEVLRSGDHEAIRAWRRAEAETRTRQRRPDLLPGAGRGPA